MRTRTILWTGAVVLLLLGPASARADDTARDASRAAFRRGVTALERQDYETAKKEFEQAYTLFSHPSILLDLGIARAHTGEYVQAERDLVRFLEEDPRASDDEVEGARSNLESVRAHLGTFRLRVVPTGARATVDDQPVALIPDAFTDVRVTLGVHRVHAEAANHSPAEATVNVDAGTVPSIDLSLAPVEPPPPPAIDVRRVVAYSLVGAGVVSAGLGVFFGVRAIDLASQYNTRGGAGFQDPGVRSDGITFRTAADVTLLVGAAAITAGVLLLVTAPRHKVPPMDAVEVHPWVSPFGAGLAGSF